MIKIGEDIQHELKPFLFNVILMTRRYYAYFRRS